MDLMIGNCKFPTPGNAGPHAPSHDATEVSVSLCGLVLATVGPLHEALGSCLNNSRFDEAVASTLRRRDTEADLIGTERWERSSFLAGDVEALENDIGHRNMEVGRAHGPRLAVQTCDRSRVVILNVQHGEIIAKRVDDREISSCA